MSASSTYHFFHLWWKAAEKIAQTSIVNIPKFNFRAISSLYCPYNQLKCLVLEGASSKAVSRPKTLWSVMIQGSSSTHNLVLKICRSLAFQHRISLQYNLICDSKVWHPMNDEWVAFSAVYHHKWKKWYVLKADIRLGIIDLGEISIRTKVWAIKACKLNIWTLSIHVWAIFSAVYHHKWKKWYLLKAVIMLNLTYLGHISIRSKVWAIKAWE